MINFREYHDDGMNFHRETKLYFGQCDKNQNISLSEILLLTSDTGVEDYFVRGLSWKVLQDNGFGILLSRMSIKIHRMPKANDVIKIKTCEEKPQGLQLYRCYEIYCGDEKLITASSSWLVVNPETRRIIKPTQFTMRPEPLSSYDFQGIPCGKITLPENMKLLDTRPIRFSDLDGNGHMNNSRYGAFTIDCLPLEYQEKTFTDFRINFSKEAILGVTLELYGYFDDENKKVIVAGKQDNQVCFESELFY